MKFYIIQFKYILIYFYTFIGKNCDKNYFLQDIHWVFTFSDDLLYLVLIQFRLRLTYSPKVET